jgi:hypothetical protein
MNYAESLLNFGMSRSSIFIIDVNNLDFYVIITIAVCFDVLLTVRHGILMSQHQLDTLYLLCLLRVDASTCFRHYSPSSGGSAQMLFGVIAIARNNICVEPPEDR